MGVYHLMGLGLSPGAVTGPISYLAHRYQRQNPEDKEFFRSSGKIVQDEEKDKSDSPPGYMQSLIIFTTRDVLEGKDEMGKQIYVNDQLSYIDNQPSYERGKEKPFELPMKELVEDLVKREWPRFSNGSPTGNIFWCEVDRRDIKSTYKRIVTVIATLKSVGGLGKEIWINLTGGNNVINFALQLAATLSGDVNRLYYVQAANRNAEKCIRFTDENDYWVELPVIPLALSDINHAVFDFLEQNNRADLNNLYHHICNIHYTTLEKQNISSSEDFRKSFLTPILLRNLIFYDGNHYILGEEWSRIKPYEELLKQAREETQHGVTIKKLQTTNHWINKREISLK